MCHCTYGERAPGAKLAFVADSCGKAVTRHNLDGAEALLHQAVDGDRFPHWVFGDLIGFNGVCIVVRIRNVHGDPPQSSVVISSAGPDLG